MSSAEPFNPHSVDLDTVDPKAVVCYLNSSPNDYNGRIGLRISALFVIMATSSLTTLFPVLATRIPRLRIPRYVYLFARYFGAGVIIATAFIHLLDPAYEEIGPASCVGMSKGWDSYSWPPAIAMTAVMLIFLLDFGVEWYVEQNYECDQADVSVEKVITTCPGHSTDGANSSDEGHSSESHDDCHNSPHKPSTTGHDAHHGHQFLHSGDQDAPTPIALQTAALPTTDSHGHDTSKDTIDIESHAFLTGESPASERIFREQIAAFLILEFGVLFHSVIIGLNLGVVGEEFSTLYPVVVFHQAFEGLGIGARLSSIPFPKRLSWMPWALCVAYGLTTPIALAIGLGVATTYESAGFTASIISGVLDSISAGILLYTGLVELLARDFLFNPDRTRDKTRILFMLACLFAGCILMALLGKWA
ncbi:zinc-regulated transporter 1 [Neurospora tetrasperma FGSC 2508]|uniref:Zinc-regulated transporter 1 n=2 Tax=Neurospora TaxID=5140 RepID=A0AAJ0MLU2_9PEZI|nr:zinc-regulated transporter 1 [Neurospora tetrasperma FGSC 2508]EGO58599.1 zinc-regulated transporter 1 [Neurospora tetrasperma FGSC 2508]EGZ72672.1 zinc-regulated transporter 1 [Neurospora tetrasperma FGSC 2509]KAK3484846.1 zinc-regulated transporter 1 [Neurospora hispaniola]